MAKTPRSRGRPIVAPTDYDLSRLLAEIRAALDKKPARPLPVLTTREVEAALLAFRALRQEAWGLRHTAELYAALVSDYNAFYEEARAVGVEIFQRAGEEFWTWQRNGREGQAATPAAALIAALTRVNP